MKATSLEDIARAAGVARSTVSRALADSPRVKPATRQRIQQLARELGYVPNAVARGLTTKRTYNLGIMVLDIGKPYTAELVREIDQVAQGFGYRLILSHRGPVPERALISISLLLQQRVDAIIVPEPALPDLYLPLLERSTLPLIIINKRNGPCFVGTDNFGSARMGVIYLLDLGHKRIAYIGSYSEAEENRERQLGYEQTLLDEGVMPDTALSVVIAEPSLPAAGWRSMEKLLNLSQPPTAVFCYNDLTAIGAMGAAHAAGLNVPRDISILGFDGISMGSYSAPPLTTMAQQKKRLAELSVEMALRMIAGDAPVQSEPLPAILTVRSSTAPLPRHA